MGDSAKYITVTATDRYGKKIQPVASLNQAKIEEDLKYAGYNMIVTSELNMSPEQIYHTYHNLWTIEESFRITKSYLDALYLSKAEVENLFENCMLLEGSEYWVFRETTEVRYYTFEHLFHQ